MDIGVLIATMCGVLSTGCASFFTWLFSKRKYNSEVDSNNIKNMQESLDFYIALVNDYKSRLSDEIDSHNKEVAEIKSENAALKKEMKEQEKKFEAKLAAQQKELTMMKNQMLSVYSQVCLNFSCLDRSVTTLQKATASKTKKTKKSEPKKLKKDETDITKS